MVCADGRAGRQHSRMNNGTLSAPSGFDKIIKNRCMSVRRLVFLITQTHVSYGMTYFCPSNISTQPASATQGENNTSVSFGPRMYWHLTLTWNPECSLPSISVERWCYYLRPRWNPTAVVGSHLSGLGGLSRITGCMIEISKGEKASSCFFIIIIVVIAFLPRY